MITRSAIVARFAATVILSLAVAPLAAEAAPGSQPATSGESVASSAAAGKGADTPRVLTGYTPQRSRDQRDLEHRYQQLPTSQAYRAHLERLTRDPHPAGSSANTELAQYLASSMAASGFQIRRYRYDAYLPSLDTDVYVALVTPIRRPLNNQEYILEQDPSSKHPDLGPAWNAYSASGDVTAPVVYVNYGRKEDFAQLEKMGVTLAGCIAIARYGGNYRGFKARYAEEAGAVGLLMYTDPANGGYTSGLVYPEGSHWSQSTVQRGSIVTLGYKGDPLTPFQPALPLDTGADVRRLDPEQLDMPRIPVAPLPYGSAKEILQRMDGDPVPGGWQGALPFTYRLTGGAGLTVRLRVHQDKQLTPITNVLGTLKGTEFPDEWIILGSHYDAWTFGATDPNSGTAALLTMAEGLGQLARNGHQPRRSIMIAHWDAEEYGIIGSTEWVEQLREELSAKAVAYINADMAVTGGGVGASAAPTLKDVIIDVTRAAQYADSTVTVFQYWAPNRDPDTLPRVGNLGGGSDHVGFYTHLAIPCADIRLNGPSLYHSGYDDFAYFSRFCDPDFVYGPTVARVDGLLALRLANADILPYAVERYPAEMTAHLEALEKRAQQQGMEIDVSALHTALTRLDQAASAFTAARRQTLTDGSAAAGKDALRSVNRGLIQLERTFLHQDGLQGRPWSRSLYAGPDPYSGYAAWMLPGLRYEVEAGSVDGVKKWEQVYANAVKTLTARLQDLTERL